jgi:hypothetical protein
VLETTVVLHQFVEHLFTRVTERRMPKVVRQRDALREIFIQSQRTSDAAADARDLHRMREPRAKMVARAIEEDLRLVFQTAERAAVDDPVAVALEIGA